jgi:hypothetical protein
LKLGVPYVQTNPNDEKRPLISMSWSAWKVKAIPGIPIFVVPRLKKTPWGAAQKSGVSQKKMAQNWGQLRQLSQDDNLEK